MSELTPEKLHEIQRTLPEFRALDTIRNRRPLSRTDGQQWARLYGQLLTLFGSSEGTPLENREALRLPLRLRVNFAINREQFFTMSHDLSVRGISLNCHHNVSIAHDTVLEIGLKSSKMLGLWRSKSLEIPASIVWNNPRFNRIGLSFKSLSPASQLIIEDYLYLQMESQLSLHIEQEQSS